MHSSHSFPAAPDTIRHRVVTKLHFQRAWDRLPVLADALLDADCDEEQVLRHLRGTEKKVKEPPQHVRGCWVVELVLARWAPLPPPDPNAPKRGVLDDDELWDMLDDEDDDDGGVA